VLPTILKKFDHFTGGSTGLSFFGNPHQTGQGTGTLRLTNNQWLYALTWTIAAVLFIVVWWLLDSRFGRSLRAVRDSELAAAAAGVNRAAYKVAAFGVSAALAGIGGSLLAVNTAYISPNSFPIQLSLYLLVGAVVGLFGSIWGAVAGALLIQFLPDIVGLIPDVDTKQAGPTTFFFGAVLVALMLVLPLAVRTASALTNRGYSRPR
jgi:branched-chain amino acid transport system permease protein